LAGCVAILMPVCAILIYHGLDSTLTSFLGGERPEAFADLPIQWVVKATVPIGYLLLLLAGMCVAVRNLLFLSGREAAPVPQGELFARPGHAEASDDR
jgi:TRAP-type mannitol/chloroaromatic compound transport system permease small subunit